MTLTLQRRFLNLTRNSFYILFPAKGVVGYMPIMLGRLYGRLNGTCSLACRALKTTEMKQMFIIRNFPTSIEGRTKHPCGSRASNPRQKHSPQPPRQEASFRLRCAATAVTKKNYIEKAT